MKTIFTFLLFIIFALGVNAQFERPVDFETSGEDTVWTVFANVGDPEPSENFTLIENPDKTGINTSDTCVQFIVVASADPWAGAFSESYGTFAITQENHMMQMMVMKDITSRSGLKLEGTGVDPVEVLVSNTTTGAWELIEFDMTAGVGKTFNRLVIFPDFPETRTAGTTVLIDNISWPGGGTSVGINKMADISIYPNPTSDMITVQHPGMYGVKISNIVGQTVKSLEFNNSNSELIDVSDLKNGLYLMILETNEGILSSKFVKR